LAHGSLGQESSTAKSDQVAQDNQPHPSCAEPTPKVVAVCDEIEQAILASTVRIVLQTWIIYVEGVGHTRLHGDGHGTVKDGRYLVTHNHFDDIPLSMLTDAESAESLTVTIYRANGEQILQVPASSVELVSIEAETLVFDFGENVFDTLGVSSAEFLDFESLQLQPGAEVAQVDWDLHTAHVDWTTIQTVTVDEGTPILRLSNCIELGASGGGIFWNGSHVGNNWSRTAQCMASAANGMQPYTDIALNSPQVAGS
jgi:hypothetical protein